MGRGWAGTGPGAGPDLVGPLVPPALVLGSAVTIRCVFGEGHCSISVDKGDKGRCGEIGEEVIRQEMLVAFVGSVGAGGGAAVEWSGLQVQTARCGEGWVWGMSVKEGTGVSLGTLALDTGLTMRQEALC